MPRTPDDMMSTHEVDAEIVHLLRIAYEQNP